MENEKEILYSMALTRLPRLNVVNQRTLLSTFGSATAIYENRADLKAVIPDISSHFIDIISLIDQQLPRCEEELKWAEDHHIQPLLFNDPRYPARLRECSDAPILIYFRGNADLNALHIINMVGTRQCTEYGKDICRTFTADLARLLPDTLVVSGLAYGIDINSHRGALQNGLNTVGVLAHGLDQIYPRLHKNTAIEMLSKGGLLTEYMSRTQAEKLNFVARNRIVAGMADATVVVQSAAKGGSLITARIAGDYNRDVFAFPGRIGDEASAGCNMLIQRDEAHLITSANDLVDMMGWTPQENSSNSSSKVVQRELFVSLSEDEQRIVESLKNTDGKAINQLSVETGFPIGQLSALLFNMEMHGIVQLKSGGMYRLLI